MLWQTLRTIAKNNVGMVFKILLFLILLILFYFGYFIFVLDSYSKKITNTMTSENFVIQMEPPAITICFDPPFKPSVMEKYNISQKIFETNFYPNLIASKTIKVWGIQKLRKQEGVGG